MKKRKAAENAEVFRLSYGKAVFLCALPGKTRVVERGSQLRRRQRYSAESARISRHIAAASAAPNAEHLTSVAPSI